VNGRPAASARILELPDQSNLPSRDRLVRVEGELPRPAPPPLSLIVDDWLDGRRVYPVPPHRVPAVRPLRRLLDRMTPAIWFFVVLAAAQAITVVADAWASGGWSASSVADLALRLGDASAVALLPAAVLIWGFAAPRALRLVLAGAIVWSTLPTVAGLGWWFVRQSPGFMGLGYDPAVAAATVALVACLGPLIVAFGLMEPGRDRTESMLSMAKYVAVLAAAIALAEAARPLPRAAHSAVPSTIAAVDTMPPAVMVQGAALSLELACLVALAYTCILAVLDGRAPSRLWQCAAAGAVLLAVGTAGQLAAGGLQGAAVGVASAFGSDTGSVAMHLAGSLLMLLAFATPVWSAARDALGYGRGAPEEIFEWGPEAQPWADGSIPMNAIVAVAAGTNHALALDESGNVGAWGDDSTGQVDVPDGLSGVRAVAAGNGFSLALRFDGTVVAWGADDLGQTRVPPGLGGVTAIAAGGGFALALKDDGTVVGWGDGAESGDGGGRGAALVPAGLAGVAAISAGDRHGLALLRNGNVVAWGDNTYGQLEVPSRVAGATAISAGGDFSLALLADGTVVAWGDNTYGQLDVPADLENVTAISAGAFHALALRNDSDVVGWGGGGQRGGESAHPWRLIDFKAVAAGEGFSLAIRAA
jgi:hypothetical protein